MWLACKKCAKRVLCFIQLKYCWNEAIMFELECDNSLVSAAVIHLASRDVYHSVHRRCWHSAAYIRRTSYRSSASGSRDPVTVGNVSASFRFSRRRRAPLIAALTAFSLLVRGEEEFARDRVTAERYRRSPAAAELYRGYIGCSKLWRRRRSTAPYDSRRADGEWTLRPSRPDVE